jgi:FkbM family methyltransferase
MNYKINVVNDVETIGRSGIDVTEKEDYFICKTLNSYYICVDKDDLGYTPHAMNDGYWESWITYWMLKNVNPGSRVLDIGANHGYYSLMFSSIGCEVDACEPQPKLANLIKQSININKFDTNVLEYAFSDSIGKSTFIVPIHHGMNATLTKPGYMPHGYEEITVDTNTLDSIEYSYDFIKIDAEGAERKIWDGMQNYIERSPNTLYLVEWRYDRYEDPEKFAEEIFDKFNITYVDFEGKEKGIDLNLLYTKKNEDWMLVMRRK